MTSIARANELEIEEKGDYSMTLEFKATAYRTVGFAQCRRLTTVEAYKKPPSILTLPSE